MEIWHSGSSGRRKANSKDLSFFQTHYASIPVFQLVQSANLGLFMSGLEVPIDAPIEVKITWAENCYHKIGNQLLRDDRIAGLLNKSKKAIRASHKEMADAGVVNECKDCEEREGGSCCGAGMENRYGGVLLLINFLLDVKVPRDRPDPSSCFFLGKKGCLLPARHTICVDFLCKKITDRMDTQKIVALREKEGVELETLFVLHERIKEIISDYRFLSPARPDPVGIPKVGRALGEL